MASAEPAPRPIGFRPLSVPKQSLSAVSDGFTASDLAAKTRHRWTRTTTRSEQPCEECSMSSV
jgi:hypothetical protein